MSVHVIRMPDLGEGIAEVEVIAWRVLPGEAVAEDQVLADVMTDKATVEIPSPVAGRVLALGGEVGQMLAVGAVLIQIELGQDGPAPSPVTSVTSVTSVAAPPMPLTPPPLEPLATPDRATAPTAASAAQRPIASPAVRARAWELGIPLADIVATGTAGRIMQADLDAHAARNKGATLVLPPPAALPRPALGATHALKLVGLRRKVAQKMQESKRRIPHFSYVEEIDVSELEALRARLNTTWAAQRGHLTLLAFLIRATVLAVRAFPHVNARLDDEAGVLTWHEAVHLGIATQTDSGLMVPVLRDAQTRDLWANAAELTRLANAARNGKVVRDELSGATLTISNLGRLGGVMSTPVINHPEVAIIGVNRIVARPVIHDGAVLVRQMMNLSSSFDHRVIDGAYAAGFVQCLRDYFEHPATLFID